MLRKRKWLRRLLLDEKGISMMEVVLIIVIIGIAIVPLSQLSIINQKMGGQFGITMKAIFYAEEVMEQIIADYMAEAGGRGYQWVISNWPGTTPNPPSGLQGYVYISAQDTLNGVPYVNVQVAIEGTDIADVTLETMLVERL